MFRFKQFTIRQDRCPMKVGTDGVLLGAWTGIRPTDRRLLDVGTGTGLIALMLAQRAPWARITGVDIADTSQARENADASPWGARLDFATCPVQRFEAAEPFDLIVSNPPFFDSSLLCPDPGRTAARHGVTLPFEELCDAVVRLLGPSGRFAVVVPCSEVARLLRAAWGRLAVVRRTEVHTTPRHAARRTLLELLPTAAAAGISPTYDELFVGTGQPESYTAEYQALTRDFYLKF